MHNKSVAIIGTVGIPAKYGGFETLAEYLVKNLTSDFNITVFCSSKSYEEKLKEIHGAKLEYINLNANGIQSIPYDMISIIKAASKFDYILILGVSGCLLLPFIKPFIKAKLIINIDGLEWKRDKWSGLAKRFLKFSELIAVKYADHVVTDNQGIQEYVKKEYKIASKMIPYGGDHVQRTNFSDAVKEKYPILNSEYAFTVCRIEPENNIHIILESFSNNISLPLVIIGNWKKSIYGLDLVKKYSTTKNLFLIDPIYDLSILDQFRSNCKIYVHGHSAGGTNPSLVEAMNLGLSIVAYDVNYNRYTTKNKALYFKNANDLTKIIEQLETINLIEIKQQMKNIAQQMYTWKGVSLEYSNLFR